MSVVFYKFKSAKDADNCVFDGTGISVFDLKREIMINKRLGKGTDFDLKLYNAQTNEEYEDDALVIPRNTYVLVARVPLGKSEGVASRYLGAAVPLLPKQQVTKSAYTRPANTAKAGVDGMNQADRDGITAMFKQQEEQWKATQDKMEAARPVLKLGPGQKMPAGRGYRMEMMEPVRPPPPGYTCFRCGEKGHYINMCPTIGDKSFDNKPKIKKATGIPTMFLKTIQTKDKDNVDRGLMVTHEGDLVVAMPNDDVWVKMHQMNQKFGNIGDAYDTAPVLDHLACFICKKLLRDAVTSPCCKTNFCDDCIQKSLLEPEDIHLRLKCPKCRAVLIPDKLDVNQELRQKVVMHLRQFAQSKNEEGKLVPPKPRQPTPELNYDDPPLEKNSPKQTRAPSPVPEKKYVRDVSPESRYSSRNPSPERRYSREPTPERYRSRDTSYRDRSPDYRYERERKRSYEEDDRRREKYDDRKRPYEDERVDDRKRYRDSYYR